MDLCEACGLRCWVSGQTMARQEEVMLVVRPGGRLGSGLVLLSSGILPPNSRGLVCKRGQF